MPRDLVVGNGRVLVNFDSRLNMRDFYFPRVGQLNQIMGHKNRLGFWVQDQFRWTDDPGWDHGLGYIPDSLVTQVHSRSPELGLELQINDAVHFRENIYLKRIQVHNLADHPREVRLFFSHDFSINQTDVGDTALFDPETKSLLHYKMGRVFLIGTTQGFDQYATGTKRFGGAEGTWRDAEDGVLEGNPIAQGSVDSVAAAHLVIPPSESHSLWYWIIVSDSYDEAKKVDALIRARGAEALLQETRSYWISWVNRSQGQLTPLPTNLVSLYKRSLLVIRTQTDLGGAILAANDTDIMETNRDHYSYLWPRDGALVAHALTTAGFSQMAKAFYRLCPRLLSDRGFMWQKYNPDGSVGSSWHPWVREGQPQLPIQEDETALVLWALAQYYEATGDLELVMELFEKLVIPAADFLVAYRDPKTQLPSPSYDLWEERRGVFTFTASAVYGALEGAGRLSALFGQTKRAKDYQLAAAEIKGAAIEHLFDEEHQRFLRGVYLHGDELQKDYTLDSSVAGLFLFGLLPADDPKVVSTMEQVRSQLWVETKVGGVARYTNDYYHQKSTDIHRVPGNPWFITTLWVAEWLIDKATRTEELAEALELLTWVTRQASSSGMLGEQLHPLSGEPLSVAPLTWSHSGYVLAMQKYTRKYQSLQGNE